MVWFVSAPEMTPFLVPKEIRATEKNKTLSVLLAIFFPVSGPSCLFGIRRNKTKFMLSPVRRWKAVHFSRGFFLRFRLIVTRGFLLLVQLRKKERGFIPERKIGWTHLALEPRHRGLEFGILHTFLGKAPTLTGTVCMAFHWRFARVHGWTGSWKIFWFLEFFWT